MKNAYFIRHGESQANADINYMGSDPPLTEKGRLQAREAAKILKDKHIDVIVSSPSLRTFDTAKIIAKELGAKVVTDHRLMEGNVDETPGEPMEADNILLVGHAGSGREIRKMFTELDSDEIEQLPNAGIVQLYPHIKVVGEMVK